MSAEDELLCFLLCSCFRAAAALIEAEASPSSNRQSLLHALCSCGSADRLRPGRLRAAIVSWYWVAAAAPSLKARPLSLAVKSH